MALTFDENIQFANTYTDSFISGLAAKNPSWMTYDNAEFLSEEGNPFPYVYLSSPGKNSTSDKIRVWIQGSVHGNEPAGDEATLALLGAMNADPKWAASFLEKMDIILLPRYNPDGNACKLFPTFLLRVPRPTLQQTSSVRWPPTSTPTATIPSSFVNRPETSRNGSAPSLPTSPSTCTNTVLGPGI